MFEQSERSYNWRRIVIAERPGYCVFCRSDIDVGTFMVFAEYGPLQHEYNKAHIECALQAPNVKGKPTLAAIEQRKRDLRAAQVEQVSITELQTETTPAASYVTLPEPRRGAKYSVRIKGKELIRLSVEDEARGGVKTINAYLALAGPSGSRLNS